MNKEDLEFLIIIAKRAGDAVMSIYDSHYEVEKKEDDSPVTKADLLANKIITDALTDRFSGIPILSEESLHQKYSTRKNWDQYFCVDPIDGTKGFIAKTGDFTVNIALIEKSYPIVGVIYAPVSKALYFAQSGSGAIREVNGQRLKLPCEGGPDEKLRVVTSRAHLNQKTKDYIAELDIMGKTVESVPIGSSLKFCRVAEGLADFYPRLGPTSEWDTAAAQCIVEESGGKVLDLETKERFFYNKESLLNSHFLVIGKSILDSFTP